MIQPNRAPQKLVTIYLANLIDPIHLLEYRKNPKPSYLRTIQIWDMANISNANRFQTISARNPVLKRQRTTQTSFWEKMRFLKYQMILALKCRDQWLKAVEFYHKINNQRIYRIIHMSINCPLLRVSLENTWAWSLIKSNS